MFCKICGTENRPQSSFCANCGAKLTETVDNNNLEETPVITPGYDMSEPVEEEAYEYEEQPQKSKSVKVLIVLVVVLAVLLCGAAGVLLSKLLNPEGVGFSDNSSSAGEQQQEADEEDQEEEEKIKQEQKKCENIVKDLMDAVENENTDVIEEHLGFECGDADALAEKMAKTMADRFDCDYEALEKVSDKMMTEYFHGMESHIKETEKSDDDYIVTVSFTRLDKEAVIKEILKFDADDYRAELREEYENASKESEITLTYIEIEELVEQELIEKIIKMAEEKIADSKLITDELEFVVASDDSEWFIYTDASAFSDLEKELSIED